MGEFKGTILVGILIGFLLPSVSGSMGLFTAQLNAFGHLTITNVHKTLDSDDHLWSSSAFVVYRWFKLSTSTVERRCRLHPTCSHFTVQAMRSQGVFPGLLMGWARAQMLHDDQFGFLPSWMGSDGHLIFGDSLQNWLGD